jgi:hypothetical protein
VRLLAADVRFLWRQRADRDQDENADPDQDENADSDLSQRADRDQDENAYSHADACGRQCDPQPILRNGRRIEQRRGELDRRNESRSQ